MTDDLVLHSLRVFHNNPGIASAHATRHWRLADDLQPWSSSRTFCYRGWTWTCPHRVVKSRQDIGTPCLTLDTLCLSGEWSCLAFLPLFPSSFPLLFLSSISSFSLPSLFHFFLSLLPSPPSPSPSSPFLPPPPSSLCPSLPYSSLPLP